MSYAFSKEWFGPRFLPTRQPKFVVTNTPLHKGFRWETFYQDALRAMVGSTVIQCLLAKSPPRPLCVIHLLLFSSTHLTSLTASKKWVYTPIVCFFWSQMSSCFYSARASPRSVSIVNTIHDYPWLSKDFSVLNHNFKSSSSYWKLWIKDFSLTHFKSFSTHWNWKCGYFQFQIYYTIHFI